MKSTKMAKAKSKVHLEKKIKLQTGHEQKKKRSEVNSKVSKSGTSKLVQDVVKTTNHSKKKILDTSFIEASCQVKNVHNITKKDSATLSKKAKIVNSNACVQDKKTKKVNVRGSPALLECEQKVKNAKSSLNAEVENLDFSKTKIPKGGKQKRKNNEPSHPKGKIRTEPSIVAKRIKKVDEPFCNKVTKEDVITALLQLEKEDKMNESLKKKEKQNKSGKAKEEKLKDSVQKKEKRNKSVNSSEKEPLVKIKQQKISANGAPSSAAKANKKDSKGKKIKKAIKETSMEQKIGKKNKKRVKSKPKAKSESFCYEPVDFDEDKFNAIVNLDNITKIVEGFKTLIDTEIPKKKTHIFTDYKYMLNLTSFKIANSPKRMVKLKLQHPLAGEDDDVLLIVADLQRGAKVDYTPTIQHYEDLLRANDIKGITVMPFNQFRQEYKAYEMLRKLGNTYDYFLCDSRIVRHVSGIAGVIFQTTRRTLHAVRLTNEEKIKTEIAKALRSTAYKNFSKGCISTIPVGTNKFPARKLAENILTVVEYLKKNYPGGHPNIRNMMLRINISGFSALPIYVSTGNGPDETPYVVGEREQRMIELKKSANEILSKFHLTKEGKISKLTKEAVKNKIKIKKAKADLSEKTATDLVKKPNKGKDKLKNVEKKLNERNLKQNGNSTSQNENSEVDTSKDDENKKKKEHSNIKSKEKKSKGAFLKQNVKNNLQCDSLGESDEEQEEKDDMVDESCDEVEDYDEEGSDENDDSGYINNNEEDINDESDDDDDNDEDDDSDDDENDDDDDNDDDENDDDDED